MIINYDRNPSLTVNEKLDSLTESVQLALNEMSSDVELGINAVTVTADGDLYKAIVALGWETDVLE